MKKIKHLRFFIYFLVFFTALKANAAIIQQQEQTAETGDIVLKPEPENENGIFKKKENIVYRVNIKNNTGNDITAKISYLLTTDEGKKVKCDSEKVSIRGNGTKDILVKLLSKPAGFYRLNFMVNTPDYDDTVRKVFGVDVEAIRSKLHKPADFDVFWKQSREELEKEPPRYCVLERKDLSTERKKVYSVEMHSFGNLVIRGWLVIPRDGKKFPVHYRVPGYVVTLNPNMDNDDFIAFDLNVRGNGNSKDVISIGTDNYCLVNVENKDKYIYRGVYMDCIRGMDFLYSHGNLGIDTSKIFVEGGSQGGALALVTAALDKRVKVLTMQVPLYADIHDDMKISASYDQQVFPFKTFRRYNHIHPGFTWDKFFSTFDYYDPQNFASMVKCPVLMGIGLLDQYCPPRCSMALFNHLGSQNKEFVSVANSTHEVNMDYFMFQNLWLREKFRIP